MKAINIALLMAKQHIKTIALKEKQGQPIAKTTIRLLKSNRAQLAKQAKKN